MNRRRTIVGIGVTVIYLAVVLVLVWQKRATVFNLEPNAVGDFLAGIFGPLAVLWLILGYFQQGEELRNSAAALRLQAEELKASVQQQTELVSVTREQLAADRAALDAQYTPQLRLDVQRFTVVDDQTTIDFTLRNFGDVAQDVCIELGAYGLEFEQTFFDSIPTGEWVDVRLCGVTDSHSGSYSIPLQYKDRLSRSHMRKIGLELKSDDELMGGVWVGVNQSL